MKAKDFKLPDQNGKNHSLSQYKGKWVVLYFYPKDDTPGCTKEACNFRDSFRELIKLGVVILGVSKDSISSHKKFSEKYHLNFPILSDEDKKIIKIYIAWGKKTIFGKSFEGTLRISYLIDPKGEIVKVYKNVNPSIHAEQIIKDLETFKN